jgi:D-alanyl-lipoteichoic acid acyltransferase DltB (MBOAT superfamily)
MAFVPIYILILGFTIVIDYFAGIYLEKFQGKKKKIFLILSLIANIGVLAVFKYYNFLNENLSLFFNSIGYINTIPNLSIILPIGLSFHTFQAMSYTIEVYRGNQKAERHFGIYSLYVMFYPQLVAGPIERPQNLLHQFREKHEFDINRVLEGLKLMLWGLFMKIVIADRLAIYVNTVYGDLGHYNSKSYIFATIFFAIQIYCDFAGYSLIAIGAAKTMGFKLMTNFNRPYLSRSVSEFWKRWHISLSTWFKDYLYISLGGSRVKIQRVYLNLFIVFLVSGLWHGANWTYIVWGALNGFYIVFALITQQSRNKFNDIIGLSRNKYLYRLVQMGLTFLLVCFAFIFFRANSIHDALYIVGHLFDLHGTLHKGHQFLFSILIIVLFLLAELYLEIKHKKNIHFPKQHWFIESLFYVVIIMTIILFGVYEGGQFIYFQF